MESIEKIDYETLAKEEWQKGYTKGQEEGEIIGYEKGQKEFSSLFALIRQIAHKMLEKKESLVKELKREIVEFSLAICEKIVRQELGQKEKLAKLIDMHIGALSSFQKEVVKICLAPEDLLMLESYFHEMEVDKKEEVIFFPDLTLQRGDFRIETKTSLLNCTLSRLLDDLRSKIC